jgi:hypothetical protein
VGRDDVVAGRQPEPDPGRRTDPDPARGIGRDPAAERQGRQDDPRAAHGIEGDLELADRGDTAEVDRRLAGVDPDLDPAESGAVEAEPSRPGIDLQLEVQLGLRREADRPVGTAVEERAAAVGVDLEAVGRGLDGRAARVDVGALDGPRGARPGLHGQFAAPLGDLDLRPLAEAPRATLERRRALLVATTRDREASAGDQAAGDQSERDRAGQPGERLDRRPAQKGAEAGKDQEQWPQRPGALDRPRGDQALAGREGHGPEHDQEQPPA